MSFIQKIFLSYFQKIALVIAFVIVGILLPQTTEAVWDGNLPSVPGDTSNTKLLRVNNLYYLFFTSTTGDIFNLYLTTSTNGSAGTWGEPQIVFNEMATFEMDRVIATFDAEYNSSGNYLAFTAISSSTGQAYFVTSSDGVVWNQFDTGMTSSFGAINGLTFASGTNFVAIGYDFSSYVYTSDNWENTNSTNLPPTADGEFILGMEAYYAGSGQPNLQFVYSTINNPTSDFIFVSTTNHTDYSSTVLHSGNDGGMHTTSLALDNQGNAGFLYYDSLDTNYKFLYHNNDNTWTTSTLGLGSRDGGPAVQFFNDAPYLLYAVQTESTINFSYSTSSPYSFTPIPNIGNGAVAGFNNRMSVVYDDNINVAAAVFPSTSNTLVFATSSVDLSSGSAPTAPSGIQVSDITSSTLTVSWTDNSNNEDGFTLGYTTNTVDWYYDTGAADTVSAPMSNLTPNTSYTFEVVAFNGFGTSTSSTTSGDYTSAAVPVSVAATTLGKTSISVSWTANGNPDGTLYKVTYSNGTLIGTTTNLSYSVTGLNSGTSYTFKVAAQNESDNLTYSSYSTTASATTNASNGGSSSSFSDTTPPTNTSIKINDNAISTTNNQVTLSLGATGVYQMIISNNADFTNATWENYSFSKIWLLSTGYGEKTVYVKYRDSYFNVSPVISDSINYLSTTATVETPVVTTPTTPTPVTTPTTPTTVTPTPVIPTVTTQPVVVTPKYTFTKFLSFGMKNNEVKQLQIRLKELGYLAADITPTGYFGNLTKQAVIKLQKEHKLTPPAGYVGPGTRGVLNGK